MASFKRARRLSYLVILLVGCTFKPRLGGTEEVQLQHDDDRHSTPTFAQSNYEAAVRFPAAQLTPLLGAPLTAISFYLAELPSSCVVKIYHGKKIEISAWDKIRAGALLIDVRSPGEFHNGHLDGARNIPHLELAERIDELGGNRQQEIVLYCASGRRAGLAEETLKGLGFTQVLNGGGYQAMEQHAAVAAAPGPLVYSSELAEGLDAPGWQTHRLDSPFVVDGEELWLGIAIVHQAGAPSLGGDGGPVVENGNWYFAPDSGVWQTFGADSNWHIRALLTPAQSASSVRQQSWGQTKKAQ